MKIFLRYTMFLMLLVAAKHTQAQKPELIIPATHSAGSVIISPDEKWMVSAGSTGIKIWDNKTGSLLKNLSPGSKNIDRFERGSIYMAFDKSSRWLAMEIEDAIYLFDFDKFDLAGNIHLDGKRTAISFSPDGKSLYTAGYNGEAYDTYIIEKINLADKKTTPLQTIKVVTLASHDVTNLRFSPDEKLLLVYDRVLGGWIIDLAQNKIVKQFTEKQFLYPFDFLPNGNLLALGGEKEKLAYVLELDKKTYLPIRKSATIFKNINQVAAAYETIVFYSSTSKYGLSYQGDFTLFNATDFSFTNKKTLPKNDSYGWLTKLNLTLSPSANYFIDGASMKKYNAKSFDLLSKYGEQPLDSYVQFVFKHTDGVCLKDRTLTFENGVFNLRIVPPLSTTNKIDYSDFLYRLTNDGKTGFLYSQSYGLFKFDPNKAKIDYEYVTKVNALNKKFVGLQIFDALGLLALVGDEGVYVFDLSTLKLLYIVDIPKGMNYVVYERLDKFCDIAPDKSKMILYAEVKDSFAAIISCVDLNTKTEKWQYQAERISNLRFIDNAKRLMFSTNDKLYYLDAESGKLSGNPVQLPTFTYHTFISPSGKTGAAQIPVDTVNNAGYNIGLLDVGNRKIATIIPGSGDAVSGYVFVKNERYLLSEEEGGLCFWDLQNQRQIGKLYMFESSDDWVLLAPDGRFDATENALKKMYFTRGKEIIPLESLYEKYYVPGLLKQVWNNTLTDIVPDINEIKTLPVVKISLTTAQRNLEVSDDVPVIKTDKEQATITAEADGINDVITELRLYQNGKLVQSTRNLTVEDDSKGEKKLTKSFTVNLAEGANNFKAIAINSQRTESIPAELIAEYKPVVVQPKPSVPDIQLYVLVVGINQYKNPKYNLNYAQADALAFSESLSNGTTGLFSKVNTTILKDADATKDGITKAFEKIKADARPQDLFVFYYAGHGVVNDKKEFFLVPHDVTQLYGADDALAQKGFSAAALQQLSKDIKAQKQLFILDACQSAGALETVAAARGAAEEKAIAQLARSTGTQWLTASGSEQFASEFAQLGHGAFTWCLLQAFKGEADQGDKKLTVKELDAYLQTKVPEVTQQYKGTPQYPASYSYGNDFPIIIIK